MYFDEVPKSDPADFFNFEEQLGKLKEWIGAGVRLAKITGLRRTGKTSLLLTGLSEVRLPYILVDGRVFAPSPSISRSELIQTMERALNEFIAREGRWRERVLRWLRGVSGMEVSLTPPKVSLRWGPPWRDAADLPGIFESLGRAAEEAGRRLVLVLDEAQEFRKIVGYDLTRILAHVYDYVKGVQVMVTGSQMGFLYEFLREDDPDSPLFGRVMPEIRMSQLDRGKALEFLKEGFKQIGITPDARLLEEAVERVDGIIGWLTYLGVQAKYAGKLDAQTLESAVEKGARLSAQEVEHFLSSHPQARKRYLEILKVVASMEGARWSEIKAGLETRERKTIADNTFSELLQNLVKSDLVCKRDEAYFVSDPLLLRALRSGIV
jgi:AAA+ ATPase superfamily predicted ATPase